MSSLASKMMSHVRQRGLALLTAAVLASAPAVVRADNIDKELVKKGPELLQELKKKGYHNVGVLKFTVKKGKSELTFNAGSLNHNMATRLENALILANDAENPMGIIRDATSVAAAQAPKATYLTPEGRDQLFKLSYPLAWGNQKVTADAFISGVVDLSSDMKETSLKLVVCDKKSGKLQDLMSFSGIRTDRSILADSGQSFALAKRALRSRDLGDSAADALTNWANESAQSNDSSASTTANTPNADNPRDSFDLVKLEVLVNGTAQAITKDSASPGEYRMDKLVEGQSVVFQLTNLTAEKIGVVIKVNGQSTINKEEAADEQCTRWMLEPSGKNLLRGFYLDKTGGGTEVEVFRVLNDEESKSAWASFGDQAAAAHGTRLQCSGHVETVAEQGAARHRSGRQGNGPQGHGPGGAGDAGRRRQGRRHAGFVGVRESAVRRQRAHHVLREPGPMRRADRQSFHTTAREPIPCRCACALR
jgi:hypothetical protein